MIDSGEIKRFDWLGRIVIPIKIRKEAFDIGDTEGMPMQIFYEKNGTIILKPVYEILETFQGYAIRKRNGESWLYISKVYNGEYTWVRDYTYSKFFSLNTAKNHIKNLIQLDSTENAKT